MSFRLKIDNADVSGFFFTDGANSYSPPERLERFLQNGEPPVFIGFGSIVVDNADRLTRVIEEAAEKCGVRVVLSEGWSKLGRGCNNDRILVIGDVPHGNRPPAANTPSPFSHLSTA